MPPKSNTTHANTEGSAQPFKGEVLGLTSGWTSTHEKSCKTTKSEKKILQKENKKKEKKPSFCPLQMPGSRGMGVLQKKPLAGKKEAEKRKFNENKTRKLMSGWTRVREGQDLWDAQLMARKRKWKKSPI